MALWWRWQGLGLFGWCSGEDEGGDDNDNDCSNGLTVEGSFVVE